MQQAMLGGLGPMGNQPRFSWSGTYVMASSHPGFKAVQAKIAQKYGSKKAGAILAASTRKASASAKSKNPKLKKVK
jgi:hypothetical protein